MSLNADQGMGPEPIEVEVTQDYGEPDGTPPSPRGESVGNFSR
jgi:hypothetical protein